MNQYNGNRLHSSLLHSSLQGGLMLLGLGSGLTLGLGACGQLEQSIGGADSNEVSNDDWVDSDGDPSSDSGETDNASISGSGRDLSDACGGSLDFTHRYTASVAKHLGLDPDTRIDYEWMSDAVFEDSCPEAPMSCSQPGRVRARNLPQMDEIARAVVSANGVECPSVLEEGLAQVLGNPVYQDLQLGDELVLAGDIEVMLTAAPIDPADIERAGHFVAYLAEVYGLTRVVDLCDALGQRPTLLDWQRASVEVLDHGLDDVGLWYAGYPLCTTQQSRARLLECEGEIDYVVEPNQVTSFSVPMECARADAIGPIDGEMLVARRIWVEDPVYAEVIVRDSAGQAVSDVLMTQHCASCSDEPRVNGNDHPTEWFALEAGLHVMWLSLPVDQVDRYDVEVRALSN